MYITKNTDYSLRTLMLLALKEPDELVSIEEISKTLSLSKTHLMKVVNTLATLEFVETVRGRNGGVRLNLDCEDINIGSVFRNLNEILEIVDCSTGPCLFAGSCELSKAFDRASDAFLKELDKYTLADLVNKRGKLQKIVFRHSG